MAATKIPVADKTASAFVSPTGESGPQAYFEIEGAAAIVRDVVGQQDPPGGLLSNRAASMLLDGIKDAREGRVSPLDLSLLDLCEDE